MQNSSFVWRYDASVINIEDKDEALLGEKAFIYRRLNPSSSDETGLKVVILCAAGVLEAIYIFKQFKCVGKSICKIWKIRNRKRVRDLGGGVM